MKRSFSLRLGSLLCGLGLVMLLALSVALCLPGQISAQTVTPPHITVLTKNYLPEYDLSTAEFLEREFEFAGSPAFGLISYTLVTSLTQETLEGSVALVIDESTDISLTVSEVSAVHTFVGRGGRVGLFTLPRFYWTQSDAPNPAAYQGLADIWGVTGVGDPDPTEVLSGTSSAVVAEVHDPALTFNGPYTVTEETVQTNNFEPFSPITATKAVSLLISTAPGQRPVGVINDDGIFVTNSIGDALQPGDSNETYAQFVVDALVWLTTGGPMLHNQLYLPIIRSTAAG